MKLIEQVQGENPSTIGLSGRGGGDDKPFRMVLGWWLHGQGTWYFNHSPVIQPFHGTDSEVTTLSSNGIPNDDSADTWLSAGVDYSSLNSHGR